MIFALPIVLGVICLVLLIVACRLSSGIRFGTVGALVGVTIGLPTAFLLSLFRDFAPAISLGDVSVTALIWMPVGAGILGLVAGLVINMARK